jgi:hypothetical protein
MANWQQGHGKVRSTDVDILYLHLHVGFRNLVSGVPSGEALEKSGRDNSGRESSGIATIVIVE